MNDESSGHSPEPEPKRSGGPPEPPKKTARDLGEPSPGGDRTGLHIELSATRLTLLLEFIYGGSQASAVDMLEEELAEAVFRLKRFCDFGPAASRGRMQHTLRQLRDYRSRNPLAAGERAQTCLDRWKEAQKILDELG